MGQCKPGIQGDRLLQQRHALVVALRRVDQRRPLLDQGAHPHVECALTKLDWQNPHIIFYMDVVGEGGKVANWSWELPSPNQLLRAGWTRTSMKIGDKITVDGLPARDGSNHGMAQTVVLVSTGKQLFAGKAEEP